MQRDHLALLRKVWHVCRIRFQYNEHTVGTYYRKLGIDVGEDCRIFANILISEPRLLKIGNHVTITKGVQLITHDGGTWVLRLKYPGHGRPGPIVIHDNCFIGINSVILPNVSIGPNSLVGAGAVVTKDVASGTVVAGNPARVIKTLDDYEAKMLKDPTFRKWGTLKEVYRYFGV
jgi:acetyltransferase-like isoleucine patch superfamily enzyme